MINIFQPVGSSPTTTQGDLIVRGATSDGRLAIGANATVLTSNGTTATWAAPAGGGLTIGTTTITSGTSTRILFDASGVVSETNGATWDATNKALTIGGATVTTSKPILDLSQTVNSGAVTFTALKLAVTYTAAASVRFFEFFSGASGTTSVASLTTNSIGEGVMTCRTFVASAYTNSSNFFRLDSTGGGMVASKVFVGIGGDVGAGTPETRLYSVAAGILGIRANSSTAGAAVSMVEQTAPSAPAANGVYIYAVDNGAGKTQLMALFSSGVAQQIAIEP